MAVSDDPGLREDKLVVEAREKKGFETRKSWRGSLKPDLGAYVRSANTRKENNDEGLVPGIHCAHHRSRLGAPIPRVVEDASGVQLKSSKIGGLEPVPAEATAAFTRTTVTVVMKVTAALHTPTTKRSPG